MDLNGKRGLSIIVFNERRHYLSCTKKNWVISSYFGLRIHSTRMIQMMKNIYFLEVSSVIPFWNHKPKPIWMVMKTRVAMTTMTLSTITMTKFCPNYWVSYLFRITSSSQQWQQQLRKAWQRYQQQVNSYQKNQVLRFTNDKLILNDYKNNKLFFKSIKYWL